MSAGPCSYGLQGQGAAEPDPVHHQPDLLRPRAQGARQAAAVGVGRQHRRRPSGEATESGPDRLGRMKGTAMPKGYWIARVDVRDAEGYKDYVAAAKLAFDRFDVKFLARGGAHEKAVHGANHERLLNRAGALCPGISGRRRRTSRAGHRRRRPLRAPRHHVKRVGPHAGDPRGAVTSARVR